jgi:hypothetical protein
LHNRQHHSRQFTRQSRESEPQGKRCNASPETNPLAPRFFARAHLFVSRNNFVAAVFKPLAQTEKGANPWHA